MPLLWETKHDPLHKVEAKSSFNLDPWQSLKVRPEKRPAELTVRYVSSQQK